MPRGVLLTELGLAAHMLIFVSSKGCSPELTWPNEPGYRNHRAGSQNRVKAPGGPGLRLSGDTVAVSTLPASNLPVPKGALFLGLLCCPSRLLVSQHTAENRLRFAILDNCSTKLSFPSSTINVPQTRVKACHHPFSSARMQQLRNNYAGSDFLRETAYGQ